MVRLLFIFVGALFFNSTAQAAITWSFAQAGLSGYPSVPSICVALEPWISAGSGQPLTYSHHEVRTSDARCRFKTSSGVTNGEAYVKKDGTECDPGEEFDLSIGQCKVPDDVRCLSTLGSSIDHEFNRGPLNDESQRNSPPPEICQNACQFENSGIVKTCVRFHEGENLDDIFCTVSYSATGQVCTSGDPAPGSEFDQPPSKPPMKADPAFSKDSSCGDWQTDEFGKATRSCNSTSESKDPGKLDCDGDSCKAGVPPPKYEKTEVDKTTEKKTNPDGSTDSTTNTSTKKTTCKGAEPCKETGKEETETEGTDADGEPKSGEYDCVGSDCKDEESEEEPSKVSGESCDATISCEGDAIQCAILQKQKDQACAFEESQNWDDNKQKVTDLFQGEQYEVEEETVEVPSFIGSGTRFLSGSCPAPRTVTLLSGPRLELEFSPFCTFAEMLAPIIVACALLFGALYVGRGMGA